MSSVATVGAQEDVENLRPVSIDEIPAPARDTILSQVGSGTLMQVNEGTLQGEPVYGARIYHGSYRLIVQGDAAGNILGLRQVA